MGIAPTPNDPSSEITVGRIGAGIYVVELVGDHGFHNSREIGATLRTLAHRNCCLVLDLSRATSVDSSVIREIVVANDNATGIGQRFRLQVREEGHIEQVLQLTSLDQVVPVYHSRREALAAP
jgi:anti-anti-sigma factor